MRRRRPCRKPPPAHMPACSAIAIVFLPSAPPGLCVGACGALELLARIADTPMGRLGASAWLLLPLIAASGAMDTAAGPQRLSAEPLGDGDAWNASITVSLADRKPISPLLYGIFFEEASGRERGNWERRRRPPLPLPPPPGCRLSRSHAMAATPTRRLGTPEMAGSTRSLCKTAGQHGSSLAAGAHAAGSTGRSCCPPRQPLGPLARLMPSCVHSHAAPHCTRLPHPPATASMPWLPPPAFWSRASGGRRSTLPPCWPCTATPWSRCTRPGG